MGHVSADTLRERREREQRNKKAEELRAKELAKARKKLEEIKRPFDEFETASKEVREDAFLNFITSLCASFDHFESYHEVNTKRTLNAARRKDAVDEWQKTSETRIPRHELPKDEPHDGKWPTEIMPTYRDYLFRFHKLTEVGGVPPIEAMSFEDLWRWFWRKL